MLGGQTAALLVALLGRALQLEEGSYTFTAECRLQPATHLVSHKNSCDMFACVASDGQDDESQKGLAQPRLRAHFTDCVSQKSAVAVCHQISSSLHSLRLCMATAAHSR